MINHGLLGNSKHLRHAKEDVYKSRNKILYNQARHLTKEIRVAKRGFSEKLKKQFSANDPASVWIGLRNITPHIPCVCKHTWQ